jgi:hypothetical protein
MGWFQYSSTNCQLCMGSYGYVPLCQAPTAAASQGPEAGHAYLQQEAMGMLDQGPGSLSWVDERGGNGRQVVKS